MGDFDKNIAFVDERTDVCPKNVLLRRCERRDRVLRWLRSCAICGSIRPPIDLVCESCMGRLLAVRNRRESLRQEDYPFPVLSLWTWDIENDFFLRPLIKYFKGGQAARFARIVTEILAYERATTVSSLNGPLCFVYPPSSRGGQYQGHAWLLAESFARLWPGDSHVQALRRREVIMGSSQKSKGLDDRTRLRLFLDKENISRLSSLGATWICVDDVITSGATAMAAYMALGEPDGYEVWTLVSRPKLAGKSGF